ncbi:unnamed protein product (macronuclear) [Paramecium tetraurelia]|uniref:MPN domain-containing protein n=1 Tax=Paramecium tetraurelia TaxID=5888 RepID=A0C2G9_PARTE|nr:uncharacterized protein GSPATT00034464001 [Paramecium tetraurelia]CAK64986.1 unnamed protein product [Paramecium tetraurelia]|eukprot:XP_001432383.1 hypothetical protein (macronuclear) [Paramecium tetraurelia strain d4-2]
MNIQNLMQQLGAAHGNAPPETSIPDTAEQVTISALALIKMLKHARAGIPFEVMGLLLGDIVDDYHIRVYDVFSMPQTASSVSVESVDPIFQQKMVELLNLTGRMENCIGWYHSHPSYGCWLSSVDINTQQSYEQLNKKSIAVVIDPIQSVRGKVVIDAFRLIPQSSMITQQEPRQTTSNTGHLQKPGLEALLRGLNRYYYSINIKFKCNDLEQKMLQNLYKNSWAEGLKCNSAIENSNKNELCVEEMSKLASEYQKLIDDESKKGEQETKIKNTGKRDPKKHLGLKVDELLDENLNAILGRMMATKAF